MADDASTLEVIRLWPDGPPRRLPEGPPESAYVSPEGLAGGTTMLRNVSEPTLTVYRAAHGVGHGGSVVVCPGGGWRILAWEHEGVDVARWFAARGYTAFLLKYRVMATPGDPAAFLAAMAALNGRVAAPSTAAQAPRSLDGILLDEPTQFARQIAADDGRRAVALVRERAAEFGVSPDRIGMLGFSAGAFLVADVALEPDAPPLAFVAPIYGGETGGRPVPADAPPLFTAVALDDRLFFKIVAGLHADWSGADRPSELHVFNRGAHGFGMVKQGLPVDRWIDLLGDWLADLPNA